MNCIFILVSSKYKIQMNTSITQNTNDDNAENDVQEIVLHWVRLYLHICVYI